MCFNPSLVQHMNIGSSIYQNKKKIKVIAVIIYREDIDPKLYEELNEFNKKYFIIDKSKWMY